MARKKNAIRKHSVAPYKKEEEAAAPEEGFLPLAKWITTVEDATDENVEEYGDYAGDGNPKSEVTSVSEKWSFEGTYDPEDEAQKLIAGMKRETGDDRKLWHKIEMTDGSVAVGLATALEIVAGSGEATEHETFSCTLSYDNLPKVTP